MCVCVSVAAGDYLCVWGVVMERGSGGSPPEQVEFGRCDFLYSGDGHYLKIHSDLYPMYVS